MSPAHELGQPLEEKTPDETIELPLENIGERAPRLAPPINTLTVEALNIFSKILKTIKQPANH